ncbi:hypothetical protein TRFO_08093 [Tritrichomonas foetus]|uniref:Uncharacterized protein n=1 Tax=Tritrichomonas foetus TaxID=1144522 RepID=A0A1J4JLX1_9EUKA|nr:hypothetical protein TRFO_08093 [Tritrichomonas foetus]|eukprot:OHT00113.1 hypothetical protein TRFO_08093 [Tritrichomonas foetus]
MITEEEFEIFQQNLNAMSQENFALKEEFEELQKLTKDYQNMKEKIASLEKQREDTRLRHQESLQIFKDELAKLQKQAAEQHEENTKKNNEKINELNEKIAILNRQIKEKEESNDQIKNKIKLFDNRFNQVNQDIEQGKLKEKKYRPILQFLHRSRYLPMYMEDLAMKNHIQKETFSKNQIEMTELDTKILQLERRDKELNLQIDVKKNEVDMTKDRLKLSTEQLEEARAETAKTQHALDEARNRFKNAKEMTEKVLADRKNSSEKYQAEKIALEKELSELKEKVTENKAKIDDIHGESTKELSFYEEKIKEVRKKISTIRDTGIDPDLPSVDHDLESQIVKVIQDKKDLEREIAEMDDEIKSLDSQIEQKESELQNLTLKMKPTPKILTSPEFQEKQLLLEELVIQNRTLRETFINMATKIQNLKAENQNIRKSFRRQMESK